MRKLWLVLLVGCDVDRGRLVPETASILVETSPPDSPVLHGHHFKVIVEGQDGRCLENGDFVSASWAGSSMTVLSTGRVDSEGRCQKLELAIAREKVAGLDAQISISDDGDRIGATFSWTSLERGTTLPVAPAWELERGGMVRFRWSDPISDAPELAPTLCLAKPGVPEHCITGTRDDRDVTFSLAGVPAALDGSGTGRLSGLGVRHGSAVVCDAVRCSSEIEQEMTHPTVVRPLTSPPEN